MEAAECSNYIPKGCARISWTNNSESTEKIDDIAVLDRAFFHGGIVAAASHPSGQIGVVVAVDVTVDWSSAITSISTRNLHRIRAFARGDYVTLGPWLGRVDVVADDHLIPLPLLSRAACLHKLFSSFQEWYLAMW